MIRFFYTTFLLLLLFPFPAYSATVDGKLISIDTDGRTLTLDSGAILVLAEYVVLDGLQPGQFIRVTYTDETVDATAVDILQDTSPIEVPVQDTVDEVNGEAADPVTDVEGSPDSGNTVGSGQ